MIRTLEITPTVQERFDALDGLGFRFTLAVTQATNVDARVFLCCARPIPPGGTPIGDFHKVCSPTDLEDHPPLEPTPGADPPWFRVSTLVMDHRTREQGMETYGSIMRDVRGLLRSLARMDVQVALTPVVITEGSA